MKRARSIRMYCVCYIRSEIAWYSSCGRCARSWQHYCFQRRKGGPGILGLRSRCLDAKLLVYGLWQNKGLQSEAETPWPRKLLVCGKVIVLSLPEQVLHRGGLAHKVLVTFFPLRSSSHPDHSSMTSKDMGRLTRMSCTPGTCLAVAVLGFPAMELSIPLF